MNVEDYDTLIFCENSGASLAKLEQYARNNNRFKHELIFLSCEKNAEAKERGKGYGEMEIIRHALDACPGISSDQLVVKVTGRCRANKAGILLRELRSRKADIFCSMRSKLTWAESRLFGITVDCAKGHLLPRQESVNDLQGKCFEHALAEAVHSTILAGGSWSPLPRNPALHGYSGTFGTRFGFSPLARIKSEVRHLIEGFS